MPPPICFNHVFDISGADLSSVAKVLRSLESLSVYEKPLVDRAQAYVQRMFTGSGLPITPFSVAMALEFIETSPSRLNTPTFGRLIHKFIENQIGGQDNSSRRVDFETKRAFLRKLSGKERNSYDREEIKKEIIKFLSRKGHRHSADALLIDLLESGILKEEYSGKIIVWAHPVVRIHFWVSMLWERGASEALSKRLKARPNQTVAALMGSRIEDAGPIIQELLKMIPEAVRETRRDAFLRIQNTLPTSIFPSEDVEKKMLEDIENDRPLFQGDPKIEKQIKPRELTKAEKKEIQKKLEPILQQVVGERLDIVLNICSLLINARDTDALVKQNAIEKILDAIGLVGDTVHKILKVAASDDAKASFAFAVMSRFLEIGYADHFLGDPFLSEIFHRLLAKERNKDRRLLLLDLLLCCGEEVHEMLRDEISKSGLDIAMVFYFRILYIYQFRYHRPKDQERLRWLLKEIRRPYAAVLPNLPIPKAK